MSWIWCEPRASIRRCSSAARRVPPPCLPPRRAGRLQGPRLRDPGRHQAARPAGAAPPAGVGAERHDRGPGCRRRARPDHRSPGGAALMQPTPRAVLLFALTVALAVPWTLLAGDWWQLGVALPLTALLALGIDAALAPRRARLSVETKVPEMLAIGRPARLTVSVRTGRNI